MVRMMKNIKNFQRYSPASEEKKALERDINAIFLISDDGQDWYECQRNFSNATIKIMYDAEGIVRAITNDISSLFPENRSVAEVASLPEGASIDGTWIYEDGRVMPRQLTQRELLQQAERKKMSLLLQAEKAMAPLKDAVELEIATKEEHVRYVAWRNYRVLVSRVNVTDPDNISWPNLPE